MVVLHIKRGDQSQFLFQTTVVTKIGELVKNLTEIYNGQLKIERLCSEIEDLSKHGVALPTQMQGLTPDQIIDLKLKDEWSENYIISNEYVSNPDPIGRRNGKAPSEKLAVVLSKTAAEAKAKISKKLVEANTCLTHINVKESLDMLKGAVLIAYPMGLPLHEPVQLELENKEDLAGTQGSLEILEESSTELWWAGKLLEQDKILKDYIGNNEKTKLVVKLQKKGHGPPGREPVLTEEQHKMLMLQEFRRQEELKKLVDDDDDNYLDSPWADNRKLQKSFQGLKDIKFRF